MPLGLILRYIHWTCIQYIALFRGDQDCKHTKMQFYKHVHEKKFCNVISNNTLCKSNVISNLISLPSTLVQNIKTLIHDQKLHRVISNESRLV